MDYYYFPTSYWSRVISLVLAEKGLSPKRHFVDIRSNANFEPAYMALNDKGVVPTLVVDGDNIGNSLLIARHLDDRGGAALYQGLGSPELERWVERLESCPVMLFSYSVWVKGLRGERSADILEDKIERAEQYAERYPELRAAFSRKAAFFRTFRAQVYDAEHVAAERKSARDFLDELGERLKSNTWIGGDAFSLADCIAASMLYRMIDLKQLDHWHGAADHGLDAYYRRLRARPSFTQVFEDDPLIV